MQHSSSGDLAFNSVFDFNEARRIDITHFEQFSLRFFSTAKEHGRDPLELDGVLRDADGDATGTMAVRNNRIVATAKRLDINDTMTGEIVPGADGGFPIIMLRQDGDAKPKGFVVYYTGRLVEDGKIVGTWVNNGKAAGDFELVLVKKGSSD